MRRKSDLPTKLCATCGRPFAWRRKWARDWEQVRFCSDRCRAARSGGAGHPAEAAPPSGDPLGGGRGKGQPYCR